MMLRQLFLLPLLIASLCKAGSLFEQFPAMQKSLPHITLCTLPTPVRKLTTLQEELTRLNKLEAGTELFVKDDNFSTIDFSGNKPRKLEFLLADAKAKSCEEIITTGSAGSNFGCATAVFAAQLGFKSCLCIYSPQPNTTYLLRNALWATHAGAEFILCNNRDERKELCTIAMQKAAAPGSKTYFIPGGGSNALGTIGFVNAAFELKEQIDAGLVPCPDEIFITFGSGGSVTGLLLGLKAAKLPCHVTATCVVNDPDKTAYNDIQQLFVETNTLLQQHDSSFPLCTLTSSDVTIDHDHFYGGYGQMSKEEALAIELLYNTEQIKTDGTYAGKTLTTMLDRLHQHKGKKVLFWNTFCSGMERINLDAAWQPYFDGTIPMESFDQGI
jgi:D-cysteine desulfhydrase